ncbi:hypothetical protein V8C42DRAFT_316800 [Trichoderma barbatum]
MRNLIIREVKLYAMDSKQDCLVMSRYMSPQARVLYLAVRIISGSLYTLIACLSIRCLCDVCSLFDGVIILMCLVSLTYSTLDLIYPSLLDSKLSFYASTRFRCDIILCLGFTIASTALRRSILKETEHENLYWESDVALDEMRRVASLLAGFVSTFHMGMCVWQPL